MYIPQFKYHNYDDFVCLLQTEPKLYYHSEKINTQFFPRKWFELELVEKKEHRKSFLLSLCLSYKLNTCSRNFLCINWVKEIFLISYFRFYLYFIPFYEI